MDNTSLYKQDTYTTMAKYQCIYTCCYLDQREKKCSTPAVLRGYCEKHAIPKAYEQMTNNTRRTRLPNNRIIIHSFIQSVSQSVSQSVLCPVGRPEIQKMKKPTNENEINPKP